MAFAQPIFDLLSSTFFWGPPNFRLSLLDKSPVSSFDVLVSSFLLLATSHSLALPAPSLDEGSKAVADPACPEHSRREPGRREGPLATAPITPLESALTSHFAPKFDLKSFRMRTYVTQEGWGGIPAFSSSHLIINDLMIHHLVPVPGACSIAARASSPLKFARQRSSACTSKLLTLCIHGDSKWLDS